MTKEYKCACGEINPKKFYINQKSICKKCRSKINKSNYKENKGYIPTKKLSLCEKLTQGYNIDNITGCWKWNKAISKGVGLLFFEGKQYRAHRVSYEVFNGNIPKDFIVQHSCNNRDCINPEHLYLEENIPDPFTRFWKKCKINKETNCWEWQGEKTEKGYGRFTVSIDGNSKHFRAHRILYKLCIGDIPPNMLVCHKCDNPTCINPEHLFLGTNADNTKDMVDKDRQAKGEKHGHNKLSLDEVQYIKSYPKYRGYGVELADQFGVSKTTIYQIRNGKRWKHLT